MHKYYVTIIPFTFKHGSHVFFTDEGPGSRRKWFAEKPVGLRTAIRSFSSPHVDSIEPNFNRLFAKFILPATWTGKIIIVTRHQSSLPNFLNPSRQYLLINKGTRFTIWKDGSLWSFPKNFVYYDYLLLRSKQILRKTIKTQREFLCLIALSYL